MRVSSVVLLLIVSPLLRANHLVGTWIGTHVTEYTYCSAKPTTSGTATLILGPDNTSVAGSFAFEAQGTHGCNLTERETITFSLRGTVSGSDNFTADVIYQEHGVVGTATSTVTGTSMRLVVNIGPEDPWVIVADLTRDTTRPGPNSDVIVSSFPTGVIQRVGESTGTDSFALTNTGTSPADVVLSTTDDFFTLPTTALTIAAGATDVIGIRGVAQSSAGARTGTINVFGGGVSSIRVTLLTGETSLGTNRLAAPTTRPETVAPPTQNLVNGTVSFTNSGNATLFAIAVADVPWITPQSGMITLAAGQTVSVSYQVDRSRRLDAAALIGGAAGRISLRFVGAGGSGAKSIAPHGTTINTVSVQIVDVVKPGVSSGSIPPPAAGELIYFIAGLGGRGSRLTDLMLSNRGAAKTTDLRMYFSTSGPGSVPKLLNNLQGFDPHVAVAYPSMAKNVFDAVGQVGTLQIRGTSASGMAVAAVQLASAADGRYATTLPVFRSDRAAGAGERITLAGVEENATTHTTLYIQEVSGGHGTVQVTFVNAAGAPLLPVRPFDSMNGHALLETAVPPGASVARINVINDGGGARFAAYALVTDDDSGDSWVVSDLLRATTPPSSAFVVPLISVEGESPRRSVFLTNSGTSPIEATFDQTAQASRRRAASHGISEAAPDATLTIEPDQTTTPEISISNGYLRISSPSTTLGASARAIANRPEGGAFGSGLIALPVTASLSNGQSKRITGIDDASAAAKAAATHGTYRSTLILVETAGERATVRLTLRFVFASGTKTSAYATSTKVITIASRQMLTITDLAKAIIGDQRDAFGDLINSQLDIEVIAGAGRVGVVVQSVDNGSGDVVMRE